jgi:Ni/Co efflux regulator RcnB
MKPIARNNKCALVLVVAAIFAATPAMAQSSKSAKAAKSAPSKNSAPVTSKSYFEDRQRVVVRTYLENEYQRGRCPPGLAKKNNGCQPPGQAKKWEIGRPLPRDVIFHDLPRSVQIEIGLPPAGHRYVRIGIDILLIAIGTGMVIDALEDIMR